MRKTIYFPVERMNQKEYEEWIKNGGVPTKEKWILDSIKKNTEQLLSSSSRKVDSHSTKKGAEPLSNT